MTDVDFLRAFAQVTHQIASERDEALTELAEQRKLSANLGLDNRALQDRLQEAAARLAEHEQLRAGQAADIAYLQRTAHDQPAAADRAHTGPPGGPTHGHGQAIALNAGSRT